MMMVFFLKEDKFWAWVMTIIIIETNVEWVRDKQGHACAEP